MIAKLVGYRTIVFNALAAATFIFGPDKVPLTEADLEVLLTAATTGAIPFLIQRTADDVFVGKNEQMVYWITAAIVIYAFRGVAPVRILQSVAAGLLGASAFTGGAKTAALGLALHFFIATTAAAVYFFASRVLPRLVRQPSLWGALYGIAVWAFMNFVVLPLSAAGQPPFNLEMALILVLVHVVCVGWPIAYAARRYSG